MTYGNHHARHSHPRRMGSPCGPGRGMGRDRNEDDMNEEGGRGGWGRGGMGRGGPPWMRGRGRMFGQGDLRLLLLALIAQKPAHGYDLIRTIEARFGGAYAPSPGTIYPTLTLLEEQELIAGATEAGGKKSFTATEQGVAHLDGRKEQVDALMRRIDTLAGEAADQPVPPPVVQAVQRLRHAIMAKSGAWTEAEEARVRGVLEAAAREIVAGGK
jgi:DNA-binding PadR family transcriptional regulator